MIQIAPSLLAADFADLRSEIRKVEGGGADLLHIDVMDGHFVPNITIGVPVVRAIRRITEVPLDVHLMISEPDRYLEAFAEAGAAILTVHAEASVHLHRTLQTIRSLGMRPGVSLNPATPLSMLRHVMEEAELFLLMTVNPGFGGQSFIPGVLAKIAELRDLLPGEKDIEVDGGIGPDTAGRVVREGANILVAGTSVFGTRDPAAAVRELREIALREHGNS